VPYAVLLAAPADVPDPRRAQGQRYSMSHLLLFSVLATPAGATSPQTVIALIALPTVFTHLVIHNKIREL